MRTIFPGLATYIKGPDGKDRAHITCDRGTLERIKNKLLAHLQVEIFDAGLEDVTPEGTHLPIIHCLTTKATLSNKAIETTLTPHILHRVNYSEVLGVVSVNCNYQCLDAHEVVISAQLMLEGDPERINAANVAGISPFCRSISHIFAILAHSETQRDTIKGEGEQPTWFNGIIALPIFPLSTLIVIFSDRQHCLAV